MISILISTCVLLYKPLLQSLSDYSTRHYNFNLSFNPNFPLTIDFSPSTKLTDLQYKTPLGNTRSTVKLRQCWCYARLQRSVTAHLAKATKRRRNSLFYYRTLRKAALCNVVSAYSSHAYGLHPKRMRESQENPKNLMEFFLDTPSQL